MDARGKGGKGPVQKREDGPEGVPPPATTLARHRLAHQPSHVPHTADEVDYPDTDTGVGF
eukprot:1946622-Alexandrium_andersonii.AAC.1